MIDNTAKPQFCGVSAMAVEPRPLLSALVGGSGDAYLHTDIRGRGLNCLRSTGKRGAATARRASPDLGETLAPNKAAALPQTYSRKNHPRGCREVVIRTIQSREPIEPGTTTAMNPWRAESMLWKAVRATHILATSCSLLSVLWRWEYSGKGAVAYLSTPVSLTQQCVYFSLLP